MHTNFLRAIALGLVLSGFIGCSDEQAGEEAPSISQGAINDAAPDNTTTGDSPVDPVQVPETGASCEVIPLDLPGPDYDARLIPIESAAVRAWLGADEIPVRAQSYAPGSPALPRIGFATFDDQQVIARLVGTCGAIHGVSGTPTVEETSDSFRLEDVEGSAYCNKGSGLCTCSRSEPLEQAVVTDADEAVNVALGRIVELGLVDLPDHVTVDVIGVTVTQPQEAYGVSFGYRYDGVPVLKDSAATVGLASNGGLLRYHELAPRIAGEVGEPVELVDEAGAEARRNAAYACYPVLAMQCGYTVESETEAGVGCLIDYDNLDSGDPMTDIVSEEISLDQHQP
jgi:hypothetical protein